MNRDDFDDAVQALQSQLQEVVTAIILAHQDKVPEQVVMAAVSGLCCDQLSVVITTCEMNDEEFDRREFLDDFRADISGQADAMKAATVAALAIQQAKA